MTQLVQKLMQVLADRGDCKQEKDIILPFTDSRLALEPIRTPLQRALSPFPR